jgi:SET domain-containing protein
MYYKPLPDSVTIKNSNIQGLGLFSTCFIPKGTNFGISHIYNADFDDGWIRTPLGGFINHSDDPNIVKWKDIVTNHYHLVTIKDIENNEELTVKYTLYKIND